MKGYPLDAMHEEIAFLAYYFHWEYDSLLRLEHRERRRWCEEASKINREIMGSEKKERSLLDF
ncbi:DUF6760 family protein [Sorangium sp. So ce381]|jgi:hypothetical protein|uniref:DUF6760 family protein n=1 Tax=unclassified Sorangium TaxID=2621164 RepID=UPI003F5C7DC2